MPLRDATLAARCDGCDAIAAAACLRCDRPCCAKHAPEREHRCERCETEFDRRLELDMTTRPWREVLTLLKIFAGSGLACAAIVAAALLLLGVGPVALLASVPVGFIAGFIAMLATSVVAGARQAAGLGPDAVIRRRFLDERPGQRQLPAAPPDPEEE